MHAPGMGVPQPIGIVRRCCFEDGVSGELLARLSDYPKMKAVLDQLPPKMLSLASGRAPEPVELSHDDVKQRVEHVIGSIKQAKFTSGKDKQKVPELYKSYIERISTALMSTLTLNATSGDEAEMKPLPKVDAPPAPPLRLAASDAQPSDWPHCDIGALSELIP